VLTITDTNGAPVQQAVVTLEGARPLITNQLGKVQLPVSSKSTQIKICHVAFEDWSGVINNPVSEAIRLQSKKVSIPEINITSEHTDRTVSESIHPVKVIGQDVIRQTGAAHLDQLLELQQGVKINRDMVMGSGISLNGMGGQHVKVLVDGVPVIGRLDGNLDASQLPLNNVERIEIVSGPMSASYGTDAAGGVINIITDKSVKERFSAQASALFESVGTYDVQGGIGIRERRSSLKVLAGRTYFDGWSPNNTGRDQLWNPKEQYNGQIAYQYAANRWIGGYQVLITDDKLTDKGAPRVSPYEAYAFDQVYRTRRVTQQLTANTWFKNNRRVQASVSHAYWNRVRNTYRKDLVTLDQLAVAGLEQQDTNQAQSIHGRIVYNQSFGMHSLQGGTDIEYEIAEGKRIADGVAQTREYAAFASFEYRPHSKVQIKPSVRYGYRSDFTMPLIPSLAVKYDLSSKTAIRASYGKGFRAPSVKERYLYFVDVNHNVRGNAALMSEQSDNFYGSIQWHMFKNKSFSLTSEWNAYANSIQDEIVLARPDITSNLYTYVNAGKSEVHGGGININFSAGHFTASAGCTVNGKRQSTLVNNNGFDYYPEASAQAGYRIEKHGITLNAWYKYNGASPGYILNEDNTVSTYQNQSYALLDAAIGKSFLNNVWNLQLGVRNLLNVTDVNASIQGSAHNDGSGTIAIGTGRTLFVKLLMDLSSKSKTKNRTTNG
jgi:outer membrane receptor for ferrienterochelin and colicins